jgi:predicted nucleic acid-binding protein
MIPAGEPVFIDTNILLGACDESRETHGACVKAISESGESGFHPVTSTQVLREFLVVATRPESANGLSLQTTQALDNITEFQRFCALLEPQSSDWPNLKKLIETSSLSGKRIHDANIIATMISNGIDWLITDNPADFNNLGSVNVLTSTELSKLIFPEP